MSSIIPNSTPTPNFYYDELMYLLSANEWAVLSYATRRIFGFEKGRIKYKAIISLSTFDDGVNVIDEDTGDNIRLAFGCMLSRPVIKRALDELVKYGIMLRGPVTKDGQVWELQVDENKIDIAGLEKRLQLKTRRGRKRIAKAVKTSAQKRKKEAGTQDVPLVSEAYQTRYAQPTEQGSDGVHIESKGKASVKQDSADATAPRFAVGDWVEWNGDIGQITEIHDIEWIPRTQRSEWRYFAQLGDYPHGDIFHESELTPADPPTPPAPAFKVGDVVAYYTTGEPGTVREVMPATSTAQTVYIVEYAADHIKSAAESELYPTTPSSANMNPNWPICSRCGSELALDPLMYGTGEAFNCPNCEPCGPDSGPPTEPAAQAPADDGESEDAQGDAPNWDECKQAFEDAWDLANGRALILNTLNFGTSKKYAESNLTKPLTPEQIRNFPNWYYLSKRSGGAGMKRAQVSLPLSPPVFQQYAEQYRKHCEQPPTPTTHISNERDTGAVFDVFAPRFDVDGRYIPEDDPDAERTAA